MVIMYLRRWYGGGLLVHSGRPNKAHLGAEKQSFRLYSRLYNIFNQYYWELLLKYTKFDISENNISGLPSKLPKLFDFMWHSKKYIRQPYIAWPRGYDRGDIPPPPSLKKFLPTAPLKFLESPSVIW
jgi:hypothetical protein